jgi:cytochrome c biogenesis protein CcmG/thiol:disulfide interchange protein DsbE
MASLYPANSFTRNRAVMKKVLLIAILTIASLVANDFKHLVLKDVQGKKHKVQKTLDAEVNVVIFWATWCFPCKKEFKEVQKLKDKYGDRLKVVAIATDEPRTQSKIKPFVRKKGYDFLFLIDADGKAKKKLLVDEIPVTFVTDNSGKILFTQTGYRSGDVAKFEEFLKK